MPSDLRTILAAFLGAVCAVIISGLGRVIGEDIRTFAPRLAERMLRNAAERLDPLCADRHLEEWLAHLADIPETTGKLWHAFSTRFYGAYRLSKIVGAHPRFAGTNALRMRLLDVSLVVFGLPYLLIVGAGVAAVCFLKTGRPIVGRPALGRAGKAIKVYHFPADVEGPFGIYLHALGLRQMPMLINVVRGDLALVGPPVIYESQLHSGDCDGLVKSPRVRPGLTGFNQIGLRVGSEGDEPYINHMSVRTYLAVILRTPFAILLH